MEPGHYRGTRALDEAIMSALTKASDMATPTLLDPQEDLSDLSEALQLAIVCFDLKRDDVLDHRLTEDGVVIVTKGGKKLSWPGDEHKALALTPQDKDGVPRSDFPAANLFGRPKA